TVTGQTIESESLTLLQAAVKLKVGVFVSVPLMQGQVLGNPRVPKFEGLITPAQRAIQFVRSTPGVLSALVGQKQPGHVADNMKTARMPPLSVEQFSDMFLRN
ncbi:MAG: aldo/keto reductase, partial [Candidatus Bathyarchaeia archaeon]